MLEASRRCGENFRVVRFDELVLDTPGVMRGLAEWLDIDYDDRLAAPTFNCYPVGPNSSYETNSTGVVKEPVERYKRLLSREQEQMIRGECDELYSETLALTGGAPEA
jgi:hypothetical protein